MTIEDLNRLGGQATGDTTLDRRRTQVVGQSLMMTTSMYSSEYNTQKLPGQPVNDMR